MFSGLRTAKSRYGDYKLFWERGWYYELTQGKVLYIPLQYTQPGFLTYEKGVKINTSLMSHLMVQADERGNLTFNIIRSVPDQEQVSAGRHYIKSAPFSGTIFIDDMDGSLVEGFVYQEADALAWGGLGETDVWATLTPIKQDSIINVNQYYKNVNGTRANAPGTKCN